MALCWGSFLNACAYRLLHGYPLFTHRSFCPACKKTIHWYDLIPLISWVILRARCRSCKASISWLYPFIELLTALSLTLLWLSFPVQVFSIYAFFFSALIVTIRTDIEAFLIFRAATWGILPLGFLASAIALLPITLLGSITGALFGYIILWIARKLFWLRTRKEGIGLGDLDLLAAIGAFTGIKGAWISLIMGSVIGLAAGLAYALSIYIKNSSLSLQIKMPFGPFLALGAMLYVLMAHALEAFLLGLA
jgi:leader peptidase (prepilin peptidase) / N-methyltransferase